MYTEKEGSNQEEDSLNSNNENEFQELDNEIEKVVRGEASYEEEKVEKNGIECNSSLNTSETYTKYKNNTNLKNKNNNINLFINNNDLDKENNLKIKNINNQSSHDSLNISNNCKTINLINSD